MKPNALPLSSPLPPLPAEPRPHYFVRECDLVMKGGITSGVIYPLAIVEISKAFRLRSIGGTSAGAIAAAAAAAAEVGRQRTRNGQLPSTHDGFAELADLPAHLGQDAARGGGTKLLALFQPQRKTAALFNLLTGVLGHKGMQLAWAVWLGLLWNYRLPALAGFLVGSLALWSHSSWPVLLTALALGAVCATLAAGLRLAYDLFCVIPDNRFGMCSGMPNGQRQPGEALTVWLAAFYDRLSGEQLLRQQYALPVDRNKPLTFGDLQAQGIDLQMMTTCLTMGRPFRLPFRHDDVVKENRQFYYAEHEFRALFPKEVVDWMVAHQRPLSADEAHKKFAKADFSGLRRLPDPQDLPVVVAVRMSLSFPILLSAIPLYAFDFKAGDPEGTPHRCWFTDGGIGSNFPIHFFDSPIPTRPTFGLDLGVADADADPRVYFPKGNSGGVLVYRRHIAHSGLGRIGGFLGAIAGVAKDWNHEALSHLPGYRDRIGLVRLTGAEGGLNLNMPQRLITQLTEYGRYAGKEFVRRFGDPALSPGAPLETEMNWENHQRIRLRLLLAATAETLQSLHHARDRMEADAMPYERFFEPGIRGDGSYPWNGRPSVDRLDAQGRHTSQAGLAKWMFGQMLAMARHIEATVQARQPAGPGTNQVDPATGAPRPLPEVKLRPRI